MNVQSTKIELMQLILESNNSELLDSLRKLLTSYKQEKSSPVRLSAEEKTAIEEGLEDFNKGNFSDFRDFMREIE